MIAFAKTPQALCAPERHGCESSHHQRPEPRKMLLPAQRCINEPFALHILPIDRDYMAIQRFKGLPEFEPSDNYSNFTEMARFIAEWEWGSIRHNYPRRCLEVQYMTVVQWAKKIVAVVFIGPPEYVTQEIETGHGDIFEECFIAEATTPDMRGGCVLLHSTWGRMFIEGLQRDAERSLLACLERKAGDR